MKYDCALGEELMHKYLGTEKLQKRLEHTQGVADFAYKVATAIKSANPELTKLDPEFVGFLGYVHDIGYSIADGKHELRTIDILVNEEQVPQDIARKVMHGQLAEQFGEKEGNVSGYLPAGIEGIILTYADMSVRIGNPITMHERAEEIVARIKAIPAMPDTLKNEIETNLYKALPRFERYERIVLALAGAKSAKEFLS